MTRPRVVSLAVLLIASAGCHKGILIPRRESNGSGTYADMNMPHKNSNQTRARYVPVSLMSAEFFAQAEACAVAHNAAESVGRACGTTQAFLTAGQLTAVGLIALSAGISGRVNSDAAQRHWEYAGLGATAALAALAGFDAWLNCDERTWSQKQLATERMAKLMNAGRLATCGGHHADFEEKLRTLQIALGKLQAHPASQQKLAAKDRTPDSEVLKGVAELETALKDPLAPPQDVLVAAEMLAKQVDAPDAVDKPTVDALRRDLSREAKEIAPLKAVLCRDVQVAAQSQNRSLSSGDYMDAAHRELIECLTPRYTRFTAGAVGGAAP